MQINSVGDVVRVHAAAEPDKPAMIFNGNVTTYQELDQRSNRIANHLIESGLATDSRIAYLGRNTDSYYELFFGAAKSGRVILTINWRLAAEELAYILRDSGTVLLFVEKEFAERCFDLAPECPQLAEIVVLDARLEGHAYYPDWRDQAPAKDPALMVNPDAPFVQMYTSGTTGRPKGAVLRHDCFFHQRRAEEGAGAWADWGPNSVNLVAMPVFHIGGSGWGYITFHHGGTNIIHPEPQAERIGIDIARHRITKMFLVPTVLQGLVEYVKQHQLDVTSIEDIVYGASPISEHLLQQSVGLFGCRFIQQYGMTETTGAVTYLPPEDHRVNGSPRMQSCGIPFPGVQIKICDESGNQLPPDCVGEICIKTPAIMTCYWNRPDATRQALTDGWYHSGDAGYLDPDGYLFLSDRIKDMIVSGGENIYPAEIERVLLRHPTVAEVAVIGVPDEKWGEAAKAVLVPIAGATVDAAEIARFARSYLAGYKIPKSIDVTDALPRNASGKVLKTVIREPYWKERQRRVN
ncbi:long-chain-fatty-acid--CoA ligase [Parahaliea maris]|uniref:Long-chain-fatty-acid--CoA ligase n=1 Tax=Parahaliea maris TaxID=2716870 RepID=A0A5C9A5D0_9GAMM|nr:long-chain-fatty-acid--CoA ligase [Parahaliea maris]TXS95289.1 long-chain-fatty-acid--CoA ligase [Parahaliea maris]